MNYAKGALIEESYRVFEHWDFDLSKRDNFKSLTERNIIGAKTHASLTATMQELSRRFDPNGAHKALAVAAKDHAFPYEAFKSILFYHLAEANPTLFQFALWLSDEFHSTTFRVTTEDAAKALRERLSPYTTEREAAALLNFVIPFGFLTRTRTAKTFASIHLTDPAFLYILHRLRDIIPTVYGAVTSPLWRMFRMHSSDVERELFRLHQYNILQFQAAGSIMELSLPCKNALDYAQRMQ
jgi:hypothetical protein